jgi:hypothetical protein
MVIDKIFQSRVRIPGPCGISEYGISKPSDEERFLVRRLVAYQEAF